MFGSAYQGKRVLVTGHTGFKGSWLSHWLLGLGAEVHGIALDPETTPALFHQLGFSARLARDLRIDIRDAAALHRAVGEIRPDFIFHLAAQPLVRRSYSQPLETFATNVMGTVNLLEAVRLTGCRTTVLCITTDKVYDNREWIYGYREADPLGGRDPYSASKGATEIAVRSYVDSFFQLPGSPVRAATSRAGNVIGGGDWAPDRIVPDCVRSLSRRQIIRVRNPHATRPWQHVLEPLSGYLWQAARLDADPAAAPKSLNFGPDSGANQNVGRLVREILAHWPGEWKDESDPAAPHEAGLLALSIELARTTLGWHPVWDFDATVERTICAYRDAHRRTKSWDEIVQADLDAYTAAAAAAGLPWTAS